MSEIVKRHCKTGEPDALKGARPVRRGAVGNVLSKETTRKDFGMSEEFKQQRASRLPDGKHEGR